MSRQHRFTPLAGAGVAVAALCASPQAVVNKISARSGRGQFHTVGGFIRAIFEEPGHQDSAFMLLTALVALMFLAGIVTIGLGALQAVRGDRGGIDTMVGGAYGLVSVLVMFAVIL